MKQKSISDSIKDFGLDKRLMQKTHDSAAIRAKRRERERREKIARRKRLKEILFFTFYGVLLLYFTFVVTYLIVKLL